MKTASESGKPARPSVQSPPPLLRLRALPTFRPPAVDTRRPLTHFVHPLFPLIRPRDDSAESVAQRQQAAQIFAQTAELLRFVVSTAERVAQPQPPSARGPGGALTVSLALRCRAACLAQVLRCKRKSAERDVALLRQESNAAAQSSAPVATQALGSIAKRSDAVSQLVGFSFQLTDAWEAVAMADEAVERAVGELAARAERAAGAGGGDTAAAGAMALLLEAAGRAKQACSAVGTNGCAGKAAATADRLDAAFADVETVVEAEGRGAAGGGAGATATGAAAGAPPPPS